MSLVEKVVAFYRQRQSDGVIPLHEPQFGSSDLNHVEDCLRSGWVSSVGKYVDQAEKLVAKFTGAAGAVATVNGTSALHLALHTLGVTPGDEVLLPTLTFVATSNAVHYCHAMPHFVDVEASQMGICPNKLATYLSDTAELRDGVCYNRHTKRPIRALVFVHIFGMQGAIAEVVRIARTYHIAVVEDCAESLGTFLANDIHTGLMGDIAAISFNGNKIITCGGGGMLISQDQALLSRAKHLSTTAKLSQEGFFYHDEVGFNYRMPNLNAALLTAQLGQLEERLERKRDLFYQLQHALHTEAWPCELNEPLAPQLSNHWLLSIRVPSDEHAAIISALNVSGIMARPLWDLNHTLPMNQRCPRDTLEVSEMLLDTVICLPSSAQLARR
ncbi:LegC family aminotransferase [Maribrevibacterium harenarium]|uniref:LegC family aminotransferase n=1 Tax=Maribrevibacterium harenarium TaxID=2589817 RepID=A0A501X346_9GAMM|nr:LegC family aminotransferase [Maribrevibacterium harenarium]TPE54911.1 LegC family aminotransferase [Maribrevibacterium harenarium]